MFCIDFAQSTVELLLSACPNSLPCCSFCPCRATWWLCQTISRATLASSQTLLNPLLIGRWYTACGVHKLWSQLVSADLSRWKFGPQQQTTRQPLSITRLASPIASATSSRLIQAPVQLADAAAVGRRDSALWPHVCLTNTRVYLWCHGVTRRLKLYPRDKVLQETNEILSDIRKQYPSVKKIGVQG